MRSKYFITDYFQKSKHFLFPLINKKVQEGLINTYLLADNIKENINEYYLLCEIEKDVNLNEELEKYLYTTYETEDNTDLHVFDISSLAEEVEKFLTGSYSEYNITSKDKILKYHNWNTSVDNVKKVFPNSNTHLHFYVSLYPDKFKKEYSEGLYNAELFHWDNKQEVLNVVKTMKELCPIYDVVQETFTKQIKQ
jgi:hypothetical protein